MTYTIESVRRHFQFERSLSKSPLWKGCSLFSCKLRRALFLLVGLCVAHVLSLNAAAQVRVAFVTPGANHDVKVVRFGDPSAIDVSVGMELQPWDEISCLTGKAVVELKAGPSSAFKARDRFRVVVMPPNGVAIAVNVLSGEGAMQSDRPSSISAGDLGMGSEGTEYSISVKQTDRGPSREFLVYEGAVKVSSPAFDTSIKTGQKLVMNPLESPQARRLVSEDITRIVNLYVYVDVAKAQMSGVEVQPDLLGERLRGLYTSVFTDPKNALKRADLAVEQVNSGISSAAIYQLNKAEEYNPPGDTTQLVRIAVLKGVAIKEIGSPGEANAEFRKAIRLDPNALNESNLRNYKLTSSAIDKIRQQGDGVRSPRDLQNNLLRLIDEKRPDLAITGFLNRLSVANANSRDYYGLVRAYSNIGDIGSAEKYAPKAIELNNLDGQLSESELETAKKFLKPEKRKGPPARKAPRPPSEPSAASWPVPEAATQDQAYLFGLIAQQLYDKALAGFQKINATDSITTYGMAAIYYEWKKFDDASSLASKAIELNNRDGLLSKDAYAACSRIFQGGTKR